MIGCLYDILNVDDQHVLRATRRLFLSAGVFFFSSEEEALRSGASDGNPLNLSR